jgi:hypothetical protein
VVRVTGGMIEDGRALSLIRRALNQDTRHFDRSYTEVE